MPRPVEYPVENVKKRSINWHFRKSVPLRIFLSAFNLPVFTMGE